MSTQNPHPSTRQLLCILYWQIANITKTQNKSQQNKTPTKKKAKKTKNRTQENQKKKNKTNRQDKHK